MLPLALTYLLLTLFTFTFTSARKQPERALLSSIKTLTLRQGLKTAHNRVSALPQLKCVGGTAKGLYDIDVLRCKNAGSSYDDADVEWTCTASLPSEFKLGSTDVICEGFTSPDDPYILKGSCGVEYRLMLTKLGEEKYGRKGGDSWKDFPEGKGYSDIAAGIFWIAFIGVVIWMIYAAFIRDSGPARRGGASGYGGWGGGGGGNDDPPPPYDPSPPRKPSTYGFPRMGYSRPAAQPQQQGWRPGFWTGALGGAAAGYMAGGRGNRAQQEYGNGEGSSGWGGGRTRSGGSSSSSSSFGSARHESTGFGGTSRR